MTIYHDGRRHKRDTLLSLGLDVEVMWEYDVAPKGIPATLVRDYIATSGPWEALVPEAAKRIIKDRTLDVKIRELYSTHRDSSANGR
jgi:hypothetical protein